VDQINVVMQKKQMEKHLLKLSKELEDGSIKVDDTLNSKNIVNSINVNQRSIRQACELNTEDESRVSTDRSSLSAIQYRLKKWLIKNFEKKNLVQDVNQNINNKNLSRMTIAEELK